MRLGAVDGRRCFSLVFLVWRVERRAFSARIKAVEHANFLATAFHFETAEGPRRKPGRELGIILHTRLSRF